MDNLPIARSFVALAHHYQTATDLADGLNSCARALGFDHFALVHHVDLRSARQATVRIDNYPKDWTEHYVAARLYRDDPVHRASIATNVGFPWARVEDLISIGPSQRQLLELAARFGLRSGFTVPANIPGEAPGSCTFASQADRELSEELMLSAQLVGAYAFQAARRIVSGGVLRGSAAIALTPRQRDCVELAAQGKTDWEAGRILGLQQDSVAKAIAAARQTYDASNRTQLVVAALFDGQIGFHSVLHWRYGIAPRR